MFFFILFNLFSIVIVASTFVIMFYCSPIIFFANIGCIIYLPTNMSESLIYVHLQISSQTSVNIGWDGGVLVQTCGHYLHLDCHTSYVASLLVRHFWSYVVIQDMSLGLFYSPHTIIIIFNEFYTIFYVIL